MNDEKNNSLTQKMEELSRKRVPYEGLAMNPKDAGLLPSHDVDTLCLNELETPRNVPRGTLEDA